MFFARVIGLVLRHSSPIIVVMLVPVPRPLAAPPTARRDLRIPHARQGGAYEEMRRWEEEEASDWFDRYVIVAPPMRDKIAGIDLDVQNLLEAPRRR